MPGSTAKINVVGRWVDGLHISVFGEPGRRAFERLRTANVSRGSYELGTLPRVPGRSLVVLPRGRGRYPFVAANGDFEMFLTDAGGMPREMPRMRLRFGADFLHGHDIEEAEARVEAIAGYFLEPGFRVQVSRFDVAVDFQSPGWSMPDRKDVITRASGRIDDKGPERITGMTFGKAKGPLQVVIYDKTRDIKRRRRERAEELWVTAETYDERLPVIRVELRFFRAALRQFRTEDRDSGQSRGIDTLADLRSCVGDLIRYVVGKDGKKSWFRVASPDTRHRRSELRGAAPWWQEVSRALLEGAPEAGRTRLLTTSSHPSLQYVGRTSVAYAVKTAALARLLGLHAADSPDNFMGSFQLHLLPGYLEAKGIGSFEEAVSFEAGKILASGATPTP